MATYSHFAILVCHDYLQIIFYEIYQDCDKYSRTVLQILCENHGRQIRAFHLFFRVVFKQAFIFLKA